jgi:hypothetical protein
MPLTTNTELPDTFVALVGALGKPCMKLIDATS